MESLNIDNVKVNVLILVGTETRGRRFRPVSLDIPKPLFPLAGLPMIYHHIKACSEQLSSKLQTIYLLGSYPDSVFSSFIKTYSAKLSVSIRYLQEPRPMGTAGGMFFHRDQIFSNSASHLIVLHSDIAAAFPLSSLLSFHHNNEKAAISIVGTTVKGEESRHYGCLVAEEPSMKMLHYAEKPETFVSETINCGMYCFSPQVFEMPLRRSKSKAAIFDPLHSYRDKDEDSSLFSLETSIIPSFLAQGQVFVYMYRDFWKAIKNPGTALLSSKLYLEYYREKRKEGGNRKAKFTVIGETEIHETAQIDPTAVIGPNVTIGEGVKIGKGVRVRDSIVLGNVEVKDRAAVLTSVICSNCVIGQWCRIEGLPKYGMMPRNESGAREGVTILGAGVVADPEIVVRNCIVMPHKHLSHNYANEILL